jgi:NAD(P)H-dependent flavin oxidoreductase YrpB (nitropropane dioxygenase family)
MLGTKFTKMVGCTVPIQQAGMAALANPVLAAAVSEAGALGMVSVGGFPPEKVTRELEMVRKRTSRPFGANFLIPDLSDEDLVAVRESVKAASKLGRLVEFFYYPPESSLVKAVHSERALACWQVGSKEEAKAAVDAGCDLVIAQGIEAGGHIRGRIGLMALLDQVLSSIDVPVIAAGGIGSGRAMAAALAAGASAVRVGTRFAAAEEAGAHPVYQKAMVRAEAEDTVFTEAFSTGWPNAPHRVIRSSLEAAQAFQGDEVGERYLKATDQWAPVRRLQPVTVTKEVKGNVEAMPHWAGEGVGSVKSILPAAEIVHQLASEAERLLRRWT